jgi:signal transduction histidine kinase
MYDLSVAMFTLREMKGQANALHGFYAYDISTKEPVRVVTMFELLQSVIQENAPYAASRQIELRPSGVMNLKVVVCKRDMIRALSQLVRNAVKYNYMLDNHPVWVDIRCYHSKNGVGIDIENWGYPITADEIRRGSIYQVGKRGTFAARSKQSGFGIGLADARRVITEHGGSISIRSVPARKGGDPNNYNQPFITTVTVELPDANS